MNKAIDLSLPPGFRFHPTDEELMLYLKNKVSSSTSHLASMIAETNLYKLNPWELPDEAYFGDSEWFIFSPRERKYPRGLRPNRTATSGYWKATGTDKPILSSDASECVGVKKALVFYEGRPPKGTKTNWTMDEYRLLNASNLYMKVQGSMRLDDWVLCRVRCKDHAKEPRKQNGSNSGSSFSSDLEEHKDINDAKNVDYVKDCGLSFQENGNEEQDFEGWYIGSSNTNGNYDYEEDMNSSVKDALETIKRVLSLGALDEVVPPENPNKRPCSFVNVKLQGT